jgi:hypothetical protein
VAERKAQIARSLENGCLDEASKVAMSISLRLTEIETAAVEVASHFKVAFKKAGLTFEELRLCSEVDGNEIRPSAEMTGRADLPQETSLVFVKDSPSNSESQFWIDLACEAHVLKSQIS